MSEPRTDIGTIAGVAITFAEGSVTTFEQLLDQHVEPLTIIEVLLPAVDDARLSADGRAVLPGARDAVASAKVDAPALRQLIASQRASLKDLRMSLEGQQRRR